MTKPGKTLVERLSPNPAFNPVMNAAEQAGLLKNKTKRISARVSPALMAQAKRLTGIVDDGQLIEFALANLAVGGENPEDMFQQQMTAARKIARKRRAALRALAQ